MEQVDFLRAIIDIGSVAPLHPIPHMRDIFSLLLTDISFLTKRHYVAIWKLKSTQTAPNTAYSSGELNIFLHNCYTLSMQSAEVGVLEKMDEERFCGLL
jgi:hypothetical protein